MDNSCDGLKHTQASKFMDDAEQTSITDHQKLLGNQLIVVGKKGVRSNGIQSLLYKLYLSTNC